MKAQAGRTGKGGSKGSRTLRPEAPAKKSLYNSKGQLKERPKKRGK
jgi:hypothetical protein